MVTKGKLNFHFFCFCHLQDFSIFFIFLNYCILHIRGDRWERGDRERGTKIRIKNICPLYLTDPINYFDKNSILPPMVKWSTVIYLYLWCSCFYLFPSLFSLCLFFVFVGRVKVRQGRTEAGEWSRPILSPSRPQLSLSPPAVPGIKAGHGSYIPVIASLNIIQVK